MAATVQDVLMIDSVIAGLELLRSENEVAACSAERGEECVAEPVLAAVGPAGRQLVQGKALRLPRDRMALETFPDRTRVRREYPDSIDDAASVARLLSQAIANSDIQDRAPSSFGFNMQIVYDQNSGEDAISCLGRRLFVSATGLHEKWSKTGGFGNLVLRDGPRLWRIGFEPRLHAPDTTKVYLGTNMHAAEARLPDEGEVTRLMEELWRRSHDLIDTMDGRGGD